MDYKDGYCIVSTDQNGSLTYMTLLRVPFLGINTDKNVKEKWR